jgi:general secretion pathway protein J
MKHSRGFTLVEIMVAVLVAAILSVMAFTAMREAMENRERIKERATRLQAVQYTIRNFVQDFSQLEARPIRQPVGEGFIPAIAGGGATGEVTLSRAGWMNPVGLQRSSLQRVRYVLRDGTLYREYWMVLDAQLDPLPVSRPVLTGVREFRMRFMNDGRSWQEDWPPAVQSATGEGRDERELRWRPVAVEVTLELEDWGALTRIIEVPG